MSDYSANNKRIAKNTLFLYIRMFITLVIGLFTARVTINALGVHDYGLLNVVGGVMGFLGYFSSLLSQGTSRFLTVGLGKGDMNQLRNIFSACGTIHIVLAVVTLILGETIGLWFVNYKLVINPERMFAANYIYQLTLFSSFLGITQTPYIASITSHEKMSTFAFMSILDVAFKLIIVVMLLYVDTDKLIMYSTFYFCVSLLMFFMYRIYCLRKFEECNMQLHWDPKLYKEIWNYVGWNSIGTFAFMANNQGITILLNMFFSTVVNAARGIATTVSSQVSGFVMNFQVAAGPQIYKLYATGEYQQMNRLVCNTAKYSSYLLILIGLPVFIKTEILIRLWLGNIPEYVIPFIRITLIELFFKAIDFPIGNGIHAFGKMKLPNITSSIAYISVLPLTYIFLRLGASPVIAYIIACVSYPLAMACDLWILNKFSGFDIKFYLLHVPFKSILIILLSAILTVFVSNSFEDGWLNLILTSAVCAVVSATFVFYIGLDAEMREKVLRKVKNKLAFVFNKNT